jgi:hypothetical protein
MAICLLSLQSLAQACQTAVDETGNFYYLNDKIIQALGWSDRYSLPKDSISGYPSVSLSGNSKPLQPKFTTSLDDLKWLTRFVGDFTHYGVLRKPDGSYRAFLTIFTSSKKNPTMFVGEHPEVDTLALCAAVLFAFVDKHQEESTVNN